MLVIQRSHGLRLDVIVRLLILRCAMRHLFHFFFQATTRFALQLHVKAKLSVLSRMKKADSGGAGNMLGIHQYYSLMTFR